MIFALYWELPLNITIRKILQRWFDVSDPKTPLFPNRYGKPITTRGVFKLVKEYAYEAKLPSNITTHTSATRSVKAYWKGRQPWTRWRCWPATVRWM